MNNKENRFELKNVKDLIGHYVTIQANGKFYNNRLKLDKVKKNLLFLSNGIYSYIFNFNNVAAIYIDWHEDQEYLKHDNKSFNGLFG